MPEISVIMGVYNQLNREVLLQAVNSILNQTVKDIEFIIYDDGSCEQAAMILREVAATDDRIILIGQEENHGLAFSLNACIGKARGKYIARMDADDISYPDRLQKQKDFLENNPEYAWCGCCIDLFDENGIWGKREYPLMPTQDDYLKYSPYAHPTVMYRAEIFDTNQGYLESKETLRCEDYEIFMRFRKAGLKGANLGEILFGYREDSDSFRRRSIKHRWNEAKCRYRNFKSLGILFPKGWIYVLRPVIACMIPYTVLELYKRKRYSAQKSPLLEESMSFEKFRQIRTANKEKISPSLERSLPFEKLK